MAGRKCLRGEVFDEAQGKCVPIKQAIQLRLDIIHDTVVRGDHYDPEDIVDMQEEVEAELEELKQLLKMIRW
jgi:hypothetical protein